MSTLTPYEDREKLTIKQSKELLRKLFAKLMDEKITNIDYREGKSVRNSVFRVQTKYQGNMIVRLSSSEEALDRYEKEAWCMSKVLDLGVPAPRVVAAGNTVIPYSYSILEELPGIAADHYADTQQKRVQIWKTLGRFTRTIHTVNTAGYGLSFNWKSKHDNGFDSWRDYLHGYDIRIDRVIEVYRDIVKLPNDSLDKLGYYIEKIKNWYVYPRLAHFDLGLRNVLVNQEGEITGILDWEMARSLPAPYGDFAQVYMELLLQNDKRSLAAFIENYGYSKDNFENIREEVEAYTLIRQANHINFLNGIPAEAEVDKHRKVFKEFAFCKK